MYIFAGGSIKDMKSKHLRVAMYKTLTSMLIASTESTAYRDEVAGAQF